MGISEKFFQILKAKFSLLIRVPMGIYHWASIAASGSEGVDHRKRFSQKYVLNTCFEYLSA